VAERLAIPVIVLHPQVDAAAGSFHLDVSSIAAATPAKPSAAEPDDMALVLHTSGTPRGLRSCR